MAIPLKIRKKRVSHTFRYKLETVENVRNYASNQGISLHKAKIAIGVANRIAYSSLHRWFEQEEKLKMYSNQRKSLGIGRAAMRLDIRLDLIAEIEKNIEESITSTTKQLSVFIMDKYPDFLTRYFCPLVV
jgi:hypothetical protein